MFPILPLVKADAEQHLVWARAAVEEPDKAREIMDYVTARPQFELWSKGFSDATLGKSLGNIRAMHNPRHLAGKVQEIVFDDVHKSVQVCIKVLDPVDWTKVEEGGYTGLSIGGGYLKKWQDGELTRYTPRIAEISLVDSPCMPGARILELQKQDGSIAEVLLKGIPRSFAELRPPATFAALHKAAAYDESKHSRGKGGQFSSREAYLSGLGQGVGGALGGIGHLMTHFPHGSMAGVAASALAGTVAGHLAGKALARHTAASDDKKVSALKAGEERARGMSHGYLLGGLTVAGGVAAGAAPVVRRGIKRGGLAARQGGRAAANVGRRAQSAVATAIRDRLTEPQLAAAKPADSLHELMAAINQRVEAKSSLGSRVGRTLGLAVRTFRKADGDADELEKSLLSRMTSLTARVADHQAVKLAAKGYKAAKTAREVATFGAGAVGAAGGASAYLENRKRKPEDAITPVAQKLAVVDNLAKGGLLGIGGGITGGAALGVGLGLLHGRKPAKKHSLLGHLGYTALTGGSYLGYRAGRALAAKSPPKLAMPAHMQKQAIIGNLAKARDAKRTTLANLSDEHNTEGRIDTTGKTFPARKEYYTVPRANQAHSSKGELSDKQHDQRIAAAKARWLKEGHDDHDTHHDKLEAHAGKAFLGRANKVAAVQQQRKNFWHGVADSQDAYDKVRQHLPAAHNLMMEVPHAGGLLYNPEGVGDQHFGHNGDAKQPLHLLHPAEVDDWIKHHGSGAVAKLSPRGLISHISELVMRVDTLTEAA